MTIPSKILPSSMKSSNDFSTEYEVLQCLAFYGTLLLLKMMALGPLTGFYRMKYKAFANPEDAASMKVAPNVSHPEVERVRRNHMHDLENIPLFILLAFFYAMSRPFVMIACWHFRIYTVACFLHLLSYQVLRVMSLRSITYAIGLAVCASMAVQTLVHFALSLAF